MTKSSILIIASMHRSGSSLVASLLQSAGLHIGRQLMQPNEGNIKGYFENLDFYKFHQDVLESQGIDREGWTLQEKIEVEDRFIDLAKELVARNSLSAQWGWKDPRTTLFLDFWTELLPEAKFLLIYRSPWEVVDSLYRRGDPLFHNKPELAVKMWLHYNQKILNCYNRFSSQCLLTSLNTVISHQGNYIDAINQKFHTRLVAPESSIYDPSLLHTQGLDNYRPTLLDRYFPEAIQMYQELDARAWQPDGVSNFQWRESIEPSLYRFWPFQDWRNMRVLGTENKHLRSTLEGSQAQLQQTQVEWEQLQDQLHQTEEVLEQSQTQLHQAEAELEQSRSQLQQTEVALEQSQAQLHQTEEMLGQNHIQLKQTEEILEQSQSLLEQYRDRLQQTEEALEQSQAQLHQTQPERDQLQDQLHQAEAELEQSRSQLQQTEVVLEQSQTQLQQTQEELEQSQAQLQQTEGVLDQSQVQLQQTEEVLEQSQAQLHQTQEELEQSQRHLHQTEVVLEQSQAQLQQTRLELEQSQRHLHQTEVVLEQSQDQLQQTEAELEQSQSHLQQSQTQLRQTQIELDQSQSQFAQVQAESEQLRSHLHQTEEVLNQSQEQLQQTEVVLERSQAQPHQTEEMLGQNHIQLKQTEEILEQSQLLLKEAKEVSDRKHKMEKLEKSMQLQQNPASNPISQKNVQYELLVWNAWDAYQTGNLNAMHECLESSLRWSHSLRTENPIKWLERFKKLSSEEGISIDIQTLTSTNEWRQLMQRVMAAKRP